MNANELLRIVDSLHRDKNIDKEIVFRAIESALVTAAKKHYGEDVEISFNIDRVNGAITGSVNHEDVDYEEVIGRIGAQTAKQVIIQKVREAERDVLIGEYAAQKDQIVTGTVTRMEGGAAIVSIGTIEAILPRSEQITGETHHANERIRALICEVRSQGSRVKVVLSRTRPLFVQRLFEQEIPEIADGVITINAISREPGYRSKVGVSSIDSRVDCVGACVGVRGNRIKNIVDELANERIDIVRFDPNPEILIPNALQPAEVDEVILCQMMGRAIVLVKDTQLSLAIGRRGQNVRLASKLCKWDIEIMTQEELEDQIDRAVRGFSMLEGVSEELANRLVGEGYLSYDDLSVIEPDDLAEMGGLSLDQVDNIVIQAEEKAEEADRILELQKQQGKHEPGRNLVTRGVPREMVGDSTSNSAQGSQVEASTEATESTDSDVAVESEAVEQPQATDTTEESPEDPSTRSADVQE